MGPFPALFYITAMPLNEPCHLNKIFRTKVRDHEFSSDLNPNTQGSINNPILFHLNATLGSRLTISDNFIPIPNDQLGPQSSTFNPI